MNAEMTLRKKLNQTKKTNNNGGGGGNKKGGANTASKKKPAAGGMKKKAPPSNKNEAKKKSKQLQGKEKKEEMHDKQDQEEAPHDGEGHGRKQESDRQGTVVKPAASTSKNANKFSLQAAQKASSSSKAKKHDVGTSKKEHGNKQGKTDEGKAARTEEETAKDDYGDGEASEILVGKERSKLRNKLTSRAYHQTFDKHKPMKSLLKSDPKQYAKLMDSAKAKARAAHNEEGKLFDEKHPKGGPAQKSESNEAQKKEEPWDVE